MKKSFSKICVFLLILLIFNVVFLGNISEFNANSEDYVILGGHTIGLKLDTGVYVVGKYQVKTKENENNSPWKNSDIEEGDQIIKFNNKKIAYNSDLLLELKKTSKEVVNIDVLRNNKIIKTTIEVAQTKENDKSIGLYIKDRLMGIGTMTYIDPSTKKYAALGHGIYDNNVVIGAQSGTINASSIEGIRKGEKGIAGEKKANFFTNRLGTIETNKVTGIYGTVTSKKLLNGKKIKLAQQEEVKKGPAKIYTVIDQDKIESFNIKIIEVVKQNETNIKGIKFKVTDSNLIEKTGGIIQGMSGSPIVQNNILVGAVSHVTIDDPSIGYGVHIEWMKKDII